MYFSSASSLFEMSDVKPLTQVVTKLLSPYLIQDLARVVAAFLCCLAEVDPDGCHWTHHCFGSWPLYAMDNDNECLLNCQATGVQIELTEDELVDMVFDGSQQFQTLFHCKNPKPVEEILSIEFIDFALDGFPTDIKTVGFDRIQFYGASRETVHDVWKLVNCVRLYHIGLYSLAS
jgi:hypothetical protein